MNRNYRGNDFNTWNDDFAPQAPAVTHRRSYEQPPAPPPAPPRKTDAVKPWKAFLYTVLLVGSLMGLAALAVIMMPQVAGYFWKDFPNYAFINGEALRYDAKTVASYKQFREYMGQNVIYPGVFVDGVHVGGMTVAEAQAALSGDVEGRSDDFSVTIAVGDHTWTASPSNIPTRRDLGNVLERAYAVGRTNTVDIQTTSQTPFRQRADRASELRTAGVNLTTTFTWDHDAAKRLVDNVTAYVTRDPVNARIQSFDYNTRTFTFSESAPGVTIDGDALWDELEAALDRHETGVTITVPPIVTEPAVTTRQLSDGFGMISAYTTTTTKVANRNNNIDLACRAVNGTAVLPGKTFSFNKATGERTVAKGYREAAAISGGQSVDEVGGGVCQASSTLFNAAARANLEIVARSPHAWPSSYIEMGLDATVDWPNLDFKFKNNTENPVFIIMYYKDRKVSAEIWGLTLGRGVTIDLESKVVRNLPKPTDITYEYNPSLAWGESKTKVKAREGYVVETYKVWKQDGRETRRELLHTSTYKAYQQVIEYNGDYRY